MIILLTQLLIMLVVAHLFAYVAQKCRLPAVLGELIGGIILGPTVLGLLAPQWFEYFFTRHPDIVNTRDVVIGAGLIFFLFFVGLEMDLASFWKQRKSVLSASMLGVFIPFSLGFASVYMFSSLWGITEGGPKQFYLAAFLGTAMSISALPVIARILKDLDLLKTQFGVMVMACATLTDIMGWILFSVILKSYPGLTVSKPTIDMTLAAFVIGVAFSSFWKTKGRFYENLKWVFHYIATPLFFVSIGMKVNFILYFDGLLVLVVFLIACLGKIVGVTAACLWAGQPRREALAAGFALNARGAMEIVLATMALQVGLIDQRIFVALFVMAIVTSMISAPAIRMLNK